MAEQPIVSAVEPYQSESLIRLAHEPLGTDQPQAGKDTLKQELTFSYNIALHDNSRAPRQYKILFPSHMERSEICGLLLISIYDFSQPQYRYKITFKATETLMALNLRSCKIESTGTTHVKAYTVKSWYVWATTYPVSFCVKLEYVAEVPESFVFCSQVLGTRPTFSTEVSAAQRRQQHGGPATCLRGKAELFSEKDRRWLEDDVGQCHVLLL